MLAAARSAAGVMGNERNEVMAELLQLHHISSGRPDGLGHAVVGGLAALEHLSVQQRRDAVAEARSAAGIMGNEHNEIMAELLVLKWYVGRPDGLGYSCAGGLLELQHLSVPESQARIDDLKRKVNKTRGKANTGSGLLAANKKVLSSEFASARSEHLRDNQGAIDILVSGGILR